MNLPKADDRVPPRALCPQDAVLGDQGVSNHKREVFMATVTSRSIGQASPGRLEGALSAPQGAHPGDEAFALAPDWRIRLAPGSYAFEVMEHAHAQLLGQVRQGDDVVPANPLRFRELLGHVPTDAFGGGEDSGAEVFEGERSAEAVGHSSLRRASYTKHVERTLRQLVRAGALVRVSP
jgi:hypothetical protein